MKIRDLRYIYNSRVDFVDIWVSMLLLMTGIILVSSNPLETIKGRFLIIEIYNNLTRNGLSSISLGFFSIFVGIMNTVRILLPFKLNIYCATLMKTLTFSVFVLLFFTVVGNPPMPVATTFYFMVSLLTLDNIMRTR